MNILKKTAATAAATAFLMGAGVATASPAAAQTWITPSQVWSIGNPKTARSVDTQFGTVQVRYGTYQGRQYGWGRVMNSYDGHRLLFEVDTDGDRVPNDWRVHYISGPSVGWTHGHATSPSSARAFRACILASGQYGCSSTSNRTAWW